MNKLVVSAVALVLSASVADARSAEAVLCRLSDMRATWEVFSVGMNWGPSAVEFRPGRAGHPPDQLPTQERRSW